MSFIKTVLICSIAFFLIAVVEIFQIDPGMAIVRVYAQQSKSNDSMASGDHSIYGMSASAFFDLERVNSRIDMHSIDYGLMAAAVFHETNRRRMNHDMSKLAHLPSLDQAAMMHSETMAEKEAVFHITPDASDNRTPLDRIGNVGLDPGFVAENVATMFGIQYKAGKQVYPFEQDGEVKFSYRPGGPPISNHTYASFARALLEQWMNSPEHRKNILSETAEYLGNGFAYEKDPSGMDRFYCTQLFFARKSSL